MRATSLLFAFAMFALPLGHAYADDTQVGFVVTAAETELVNEVYRLTARVDYALSRAAQEALDNGVPLTFELQIQVLQDYWGVWDHPIASLSQRYRLQYHALSQRYLMENLNTGVHGNFGSQDEALTVLGDVTELPILDRHLLKPGERYTARMRARLDVEALPTPLRVMAYLRSDWRIASAWYAWPLNP